MGLAALPDNSDFSKSKYFRLVFIMIQKVELYAGFKIPLTARRGCDEFLLSKYVGVASQSPRS